MNPKLYILIHGHLLNPFWMKRSVRRRVRGMATLKAVDSYLDRYVPFISGLMPSTAAASPEPERIFSIWFQGEHDAPEVVKACWRSIRANCSQELVILDSNTVFDWISLPECVVGKWKSGRMRPAHFADICRLALLKQYGGLWLDATDYVSAEFPDWLWKEDFFVYMSGEKQRGWYSFVQNCFIRARQNNFLICAWLDLMLEYWSNEDKAMDYFIHQMLFKKLVENNFAAREQFDRMPKINQDLTHELWFYHGKDSYDAVLWEAITSSALFQKTEYKSAMSRKPEPGSNAAYLLSSFR